MQLTIKREKQTFTEERSPTATMVGSALKMNSIVQPKRRMEGDAIPTEGSPIDPRRKVSSSYNSKTMDKSERVVRSVLNVNSDDAQLEEEQYIMREKKKINEAFQIFAQLPP